ncbi:Maturation and nuclear export of 40S ribosomal subunits interacting protein [Fusarium piperis]|uniref:Maturation and nuclear export of 40S ribosomal subunits interacting protein n=1 Tax=Fusarium piperis TaxID=1435070 RepID=A0A9W9BSG2_9HYPO|nr:Maturation and nuclear export of 40S ribosomal subunits interacting protein [Fusarium piperis]
MPKTATEERSKRKRSSTQEKPTKRRRSSSASDESEDPNAKILLMEQGILESRKNYNDITVLLSTANDFKKGEPESMLATVALCRIFVRLLTQGALISKKSLSEKDLVVAGWLKEQFGEFKKALLAMLRDEELAPTALTLCMRTLKAEGQFMYDKEEYIFPRAFHREIMESLLVSENEDASKVYIEEFAEQYDDIRYFTFNSVKYIAEIHSDDDASPELFDRCFALLSALDGVPESADELEDYYVPRPKKKAHPLRNVTQHKKQGQEAWLAIMTLAEEKEQRKQILDIISTVIAPWFTKPELLADFLTNSYDVGGSMSLLALSGVFYLISERNLDYPSFYTKLYSLLDRDILHSKHRSRFFRLLDTFLASTHLPAALVASFIKRLARLSLNAPPSAIVFVTPWIYNLLKRHPTCTFMIHREERDPEVKKHMSEHGAEDPFLPEETDPMETQAIDSCLWELVQLQSHYHPNVATITKVISEQFTKVSYNIEDFLDHSYATLLEAEMTKNVKKAPVVEFHIPKKVFLPHETGDVEPDSLLVKLWDFEGSPQTAEVA